MFKVSVKMVLGFVVAIFILYLLAGFTGILNIAWMKTIGLQTKNVEREVFKVSNPYIESMSRDLANYKAQYDLSKSEVDKTTIIAYIHANYSNFDANKIENFPLRNFLLGIQKGSIQ
jgi:hypothetical protein